MHINVLKAKALVLGPKHAQGPNILFRKSRTINWLEISGTYKIFNKIISKTLKKHPKKKKLRPFNIKQQKGKVRSEAPKGFIEKPTI